MRGGKKWKTRIRSRDCICLLDKNRFTIPRSGELPKLTSAGLRSKQLNFSCKRNSKEAYGVIMAAFPLLVCSGYDILRIGDGGFGRLKVISPPTGGFDVQDSHSIQQ